MPKRVDANQKQIVDALREIPGVSVRCTHEVGRGFTDIIVGYKKRNFIFEIKDPEKPPSARKLTGDEETFHREWTGQVDTALCLYDIIEVIKKNGEKL